MPFEDLRGKVVLITGASRGLGRAIALEFVKYGSLVAANYNASREKAEELKKQAGENLEIFKADVSSRDQVRLMVKQVREALGPVDILVNNAGKWFLGSFEEFDEGKFEVMWRTNFMSMVYTSLEVVPDMKSRGKGAIVNVSSNAAIGTAAVGTTFYAVTKAAVVMLTRRLALELGGYGIRVNAVAPGWIETDMTIGGKSREEVEELERSFKSRTMLHMVGRPEHVAKLVVYLASEDSGFMTGQTLVMDGGRIDYLTHGI
ncbi:MAG: SDR family oxidoreductase [Thermoprotei archaeon]|jgi:3-oxoacyl-[acyl-carrier protein] reductase